MSILSDVSIIERCTSPTSYFDQEAYDRWVMSGPPIPISELGKFNTPFWNEVMARYTRELSAEERAGHLPMIAPFLPELVREVLQASDEPVQHGMEFIPRKIISMGLSSYGYDVSLAAKECWLFTNIHSGTIDPKRFSPEKCLTPMKIETDDQDGALYVVMPPNSYMLANTVEYFRIPRDIMVICLGKSTYARCGAQVNVTPIEPGFEGNVVIEIANSTNSPMRIYLNEGIAQFLFLQGDRPAAVSYGDRGGKYQGQTGVQLPKV